MNETIKDKPSPMRQRAPLKSFIKQQQRDASADKDKIMVFEPKSKN